MSPGDATDARGADAVVRALEQEGVRYAFGIPGTHNLELWDRLADSDRIVTVLVGDERGAAFMADGVWRASGQLACLNLVPGAGLTHALSGIAEAWMDGAAMLVLGCGIRRDTGHAFQLHDVDQSAIARPVTKGVFRPRAGAEIHACVRRACALARTPPAGPVMVEVPANFYLRPAHDPDASVDTDPATPSMPPVPVGPPAPEMSEARRAAEILAAARRPLLHLGAGAAGAAAMLPALAERLEAPVATSLQGKGVFPETHPLALWPGYGPAAPPFARSVAGDCDATLVLGCRFAEVGTGSYGLRPPAPVIHVDADPSVLGRNLAVALAVPADAGAFVELLLAELERFPARTPDSELRERIRRGRAEALAAMRAPSDGGVAPGRLLEALQGRLPEAVFVADSGNGTFLAAEGLVLEAPGRFLAPVDFSCMGYSVPAAVGAALALPGAPVVALVGDGAFRMTGLETLTAASLGLPVAFVVLRDGELSQISQFQATAYGRTTAAALPEFDLPAVARGLGLEAVVIASPDDLDDGLDRTVELLGMGTPVLVEVAIDASRKTWFTRGVVRTNFGRLPWRDRLRVGARAVGRRLSAGLGDALFSGDRSDTPPDPENGRAR